MNYQQTIDYLFTRLPMFSRIGAAAYKKDLTNTIALCKALNNPQHKFKSVHIAGTNGKGSVSHMLAAVLQTAGYKTGLYTSPHLHDFRERIKVNGQMISEGFVIDFTKQIQPLIEELNPSFFEITVAMAFDYFAKQEIDIAVVEVGLGGRLDSTNIITPQLSIITNIGMDHMNMLGNTLEQIAKEKAGIIKPSIPVVVGETLPQTIPVFEQAAKENNTVLQIAANEYKVINHLQQGNYLSIEIKGKQKGNNKNYELDLPGLYQTKNILTVLTAIDELKLKGWHIEDTHVHHALKNSKQINGLHGRWEMIDTNPTIVLDVGHNEDGIQQIIQQLAQTKYNQLHIVIGMVKDKDIEKVLSLLPKQATYYFTKAQIPRALNEAELQTKAAQHQLKGNAFAEVNKALAAAKQNAANDDFILVCGSVFLVGEVTLSHAAQ
jgi:dihydrofolate synthase / folylpolyglutamate synthase